MVTANARVVAKLVESVKVRVKKKRSEGLTGSKSEKRVKES